MALLAEELVEEWLNRHGYFTIRGVKAGVSEMDLLAVRHSPSGWECRHLEVQVSTNPVSYVAPLTPSLCKATGRSANSAKQRAAEEQEACVDAWVKTKFLDPRKSRVRLSLAPGPWTFEFVVHVMRHPEELEMIKAHGVRVHHFSDVVDELRAPGATIESATGGDFTNLVLLGASLRRMVNPER